MDTVQQLYLLKQIYGTTGYYDAEQNLHLHHIPNSVSKTDLEILAQHGHTPNQMFLPQHDVILEELQQHANNWSIKDATTAFIAGLWSAPFYWKSALPGMLLGKAMPKHTHIPYKGSVDVCTVCGFYNRSVDISYKWYHNMTTGIPLDSDPVGYVLAFREMILQKELPIPTEFDRWTFRAILTVLRELPPKTRYTKARDALKKEKLLPTKNQYVYENLLEVLGLIGILDTEDYPGMVTMFTSYRQRDQRPNIRVEVQAPLTWWDSSVGINEKVLKEIFSEFDCSSVSLKRRPQPHPSLEETITGALEKKRLPRMIVPKTPDSAGKGPVQAGDIYAVRVREGVWVTVYVHELKVIDILRAKVEYLKGVYDHMPALDELNLSYSKRYDGRWQQWSSSMDSTSWVRRIAREIPAPETVEPEPDRVSIGGAKDLKHLAHWCFSEIE